MNVSRRDAIKKLMVIGLGVMVHTTLVADTKVGRKEALVKLRKVYKKKAFEARVNGDLVMFKKFDDLQYNIKVQINREAGCMISKYRFNSAC